MPIVSVAIELTARNFSRVITAEEFLTPLNIQPGEVEDAWVNKAPWGSSAVRISSCRNTSRTAIIDSEALFDAWAAETFRVAGAHALDGGGGEVGDWCGIAERRRGVAEGRFSIAGRPWQRGAAAGRERQEAGAEHDQDGRARMIPSLRRVGRAYKHGPFVIAIGLVPNRARVEDSR